MASNTITTTTDDLWKKRLVLRRSDSFLAYPCRELPGIEEYCWCLDIAVVVTNSVKDLGDAPKVLALLLLRNNAGNPEYINDWGIIRHYINPREDSSKTVSRVVFDAVGNMIGLHVKDFVGDFASAELVETPDMRPQGQAGVVFLSVVVSIAEQRAVNLAGAITAIPLTLRDDSYRWVFDEEELEHLRLGLEEIKHVFAYEHIDPMKLLRMPFPNLTSHINLTWRVSGAITRHSKDGEPPVVLLLRRTDQDEVYPGRWDFPTAEVVSYMGDAETVLRKSIKYQTGLEVVKIVDSMSRDQPTPAMLRRKATREHTRGKPFDVRLTYRVLVESGKIKLKGYPFAWRWATEQDLPSIQMSWRTREHAMRALAPERDNEGRAAWSDAWDVAKSSELRVRQGGSGGRVPGSDVNDTAEDRARRGAASASKSSKRRRLVEVVDEEAELRAQSRVQATLAAQLRVQAKWAENMAQHEEAQKASVGHWNILDDD